jgi:hypothetical protein
MIEPRRRSRVRKIEPVQSVHFDEQFWPVSLALCLTAAIGAGAAVSLMKGPWMWATLVALPGLLVAALVALQRVRRGLLRRSLQLAAILSAALHLMFLIACSLTDVFGRSLPAEQLAEKPAVNERVMLVTKRESNPIWRELNRRETSDPKLEAEREPTRTEIKPPQPAEISQPRPNETAAASRRNQSAPPQPRLDESLGQLRRSEGESSPAAASPVVVESAAPAPRESAQPREATTASTSPQRTAEQPATAAAQPAEVQPANIAEALESNAARRESASSANSLPQPVEAASSARTRDRQMEIPRTEVAPVELAQTDRATAAQPPSPIAEVSPAARAEQTETVLRPGSSQPSGVVAAAPPDVARAERRQSNPTPASISQENLRATTPRRSSQAAEQIASIRPVEDPSPAPATASGSEPAPQSTATSLTRSESGSALAESGKNLQVSDLQAPGAAAVASDSVVRRRSERSADSPQLLNSQQATRERRNQASSDQPQSAWKVNTESLASRRGSRSPGERTTEASAAAATTAATSAERSRLNAEAGSSQIDLGPTKLVEDSAAERVSGGGGATSLGPLNPEQERRARSTAAAAGTLATDTLGLTQAPRTAPLESRPSGEPLPSESLASGQRAEMNQASSAVVAGPAEPGVAAAKASEVAKGAERANRQSAGSSAVSAQEAAESQLGNTRAGISRAPVAQVDVNLGSQGNQPGNAGRPEAELSIGSASAPRGTGTALGAEVSEPAGNTAGESAALATRRERGEVNAGGVALAAEELAKGRRSLSTPTMQIDAAVGSAAAALPAQGAGRTAVAEADIAQTTRRRGESGQLNVQAEVGVPGLGLQPDEALGSRSRPATRESESIALSADARFSRSDAGAMPAAATDAVLAKEAFEARGATKPGSAPATEAAIELGLEFLARHQRADGSWSLGGFDNGHPQKQGQFNSDMAATGLALLAFQGAGYTHREFKYAGQMQRALEWITTRQAADGGLYLNADERSDSNCRMYSHAIATLALNEAYGMTQDSQLREPCQKALAYIAKTQDDQGGWRYYAEPQLRQSDTSVTGWMMMALQSGRLAGLEVPESTWEGIRHWLELSRDPQREALYRYNPFAQDSGGIDRSAGRRPTVSMTSVGLLMRLYLGWERDDPRMIDGADYLLSQQFPGERTSLERDTYYWYYATQVLRHVGGERWERWNSRLHPLLVKTQTKTGDMAGSWHPYEPVPDRWGPAAGRLYVTTMNLLSLEVNYRLLPLYLDVRTAGYGGR